MSNKEVLVQVEIHPLGYVYRAYLKRGYHYKEVAVSANLDELRERFHPCQLVIVKPNTIDNKR
jgi:hypothetical protein